MTKTLEQLIDHLDAFAVPAVPEHRYRVMRLEIGRFVDAAVAKARRDALEVAAKQCDRMAASWADVAGRMYPDDPEHASSRKAARQLVLAGGCIRALIDAPEKDTTV